MVLSLEDDVLQSLVICADDPSLQKRLWKDRLHSHEIILSLSGVEESHDLFGDRILEVQLSQRSFVDRVIGGLALFGNPDPVGVQVLMDHSRGCDVNPDLHRFQEFIVSSPETREAASDI